MIPGYKQLILLIDEYQPMEESDIEFKETGDDMDFGQADQNGEIGRKDEVVGTASVL